MPLVTPTQIANYAAAAGFSGTDLAIAVAIALAESSGNTTATHKNNNGSVDYGLWQINSVHSDLLNASWSDGAANARMAYAIYSRAGNRFTDWVTYNSGAYTLYMPQAVVGAAAVKTFTDNTDADNDTSNVKGTDFESVADWFGSQLIRANRADVTPHIYVPTAWRKNQRITATANDGGTIVLTITNGLGTLNWIEKDSLTGSLLYTGKATFDFDPKTGITDGKLKLYAHAPSQNDPTLAQILGLPGADAGAAIGKAVNNTIGGLGNLLIFGKLGNLDIGYVALIIVGGIGVLLGGVLLAKGHLT